MSGKKKTILLIAAFMGVFVIGFFAGRFIAWLEGPDKRVIYEAQINGALKTAKKYGLDHVYLKDLTDFDWEKVCVVLPYMSNKDIKQKTGIKYYDFTDHEGQWGLLFIDKKEKLIPIKIERYNTVDTVYSYNEKFPFKGAVYCAEKDSAKLIFYEKQFWKTLPKSKHVALVQQ